MAGNQVSGEGEGSTMNSQTGIFIRRVRRFLKSLRQRIWEVGREDPRRVIHALKVGLALTLVSMLYLLEPLFEGIGQNAMWAVITVVVVLEFTAGATLCKGLNRGFGTLCAGSLAFFIDFIAQESGKVCRAVFIGASVFLVGAMATYMRFFPYLKKNYDYGIVIFLLTFNLITVSSFRVRDVLKIANERLYTIAIGCGLCLFMCLLVFPNWSGEDLHNSMAVKLETLARSVEACVKGYFYEEDIQLIRSESFKDQIRSYKNVLDSKSMEETSAMFASWEPRHSRQCHRYPWQQYVKFGSVLRYFAYTAVALHGCLESEIQAPWSVRKLFRDPCIRVAGEVAKVLLELADSIRNRRLCSQDVLSDKLQEALRDLNSAIKTQPRLFLGSNPPHTSSMLVAAVAAAERKADKELGVSSSIKSESPALVEWQRRSKRSMDQSKDSDRKVLRPTLSKIAITSLEFSEALPFAAFASLLLEMVARLDVVIEEVEELGRKARFREFTEKSDIENQVNCPKTNAETSLYRHTNSVSQSTE
ncbi:aluminum-activated malate transporter 12-like [Tasmannia lanceolata]|uniref:aluminum-activated malate transporter 12-like n=1 Tax=Tasmannia lanceolata TaxID=3420 RepID=UPI004064C544